MSLLSLTISGWRVVDGKPCGEERDQMTRRKTVKAKGRKRQRMDFCFTDHELWFWTYRTMSSTSDEKMCILRFLSAFNSRRMNHGRQCCSNLITAAFTFRAQQQQEGQIWIGLVWTVSQPALQHGLGLCFDMILFVLWRYDLPCAKV